MDNITNKQFIVDSYKEFLKGFVTDVLNEFGEDIIEDFIVTEVCDTVYSETAPYVVDTILDSYTKFDGGEIEEGSLNEEYIASVFDFIDTCMTNLVKKDHKKPDPEQFKSMVDSIGADIAVLIEASVFNALEDYYDFEYDEGDYEEGEYDEEEYDEDEYLEEAKRTAKVIRGGKVVTKKIDTVKRPKRMSPKQKAALRKARRKAHTGAASRKRKKSVKRRSKISTGQQRAASRTMGKRRLLQRTAEDSHYMEVNSIYLAEYDFDLANNEGEVYKVESGYILDIYDNGNKVIVDAYDHDGNIVIEGIVVLPKTVNYYFAEGLLESISVDGNTISDIYLEGVYEGLEGEDLLNETLSDIYINEVVTKADFDKRLDELYKKSKQDLLELYGRNRKVHGAEKNTPKDHLVSSILQDEGYERFMS